jgi:hypothetical protein
VLGQDTVKMSAVGVNVVTHRSLSCFIGGADRPGQLPKVEGLWAIADGKLVVSATLRLQPIGPEIAICTRDGALDVIAQGGTLEPGSVTVQGGVVSWTQEGHRHAMRV